MRNLTTQWIFSLLILCLTYHIQIKKVYGVRICYVGAVLGLGLGLGLVVKVANLADHQSNTTNYTHFKCQGFKTLTYSQRWDRSVRYNHPGFALLVLFCPFYCNCLRNSFQLVIIYLLVLQGSACVVERLRSLSSDYKLNSTLYQP